MLTILKENMGNYIEGRIGGKIYFTILPFLFYRRHNLFILDFEQNIDGGYTMKHFVCFRVHAETK